MKYDNTIPIYIQIIEKIKQDILTGARVQGEKMPSIQDMAVEMGVNQNTMYRVYKDCESLGIIETKRGIGSFVVSDPAIIENLRQEQINRIVQTFITGLKELHFSHAEIQKTLETALQEL